MHYLGTGTNRELGIIVGVLGRRLELESFVRRLGRQLELEGFAGWLIELGLDLDLGRGDGKRECCVDNFGNCTACLQFPVLKTNSSSRKCRAESQRTWNSSQRKMCTSAVVSVLRRVHAASPGPYCRLTEYIKRLGHRYGDFRSSKPTAAAASAELSHNALGTVASVKYVLRR